LLAAPSQARIHRRTQCVVYRVTEL